MTFTQFLSVLRARIWLLTLTFVFFVVAAIGVIMIVPRQYIGVASFVVDVKPDPITAVGLPSLATPTFVATQADIVTSDRVALRVIRDLKLLDNKDLQEQWREESQGRGSVEQWLVAALSKGLNVKPSLTSNVVVVEYKARDPNFAAAMANAFVSAYLATVLELRVDPAKQYASFFNNQMKEAREALAAAQAKLSAFQQQRGIISSDERLDVENARLIELNSQVTQLQAISAETAGRQRQIEGQNADRMTEVIANPLIAQLKGALAQNEAKLQELTQRLGDANPQVIEARANIAELRKRLDLETVRVGASVSVTNNINISREAQVRRELEAQRAKVMHLKALRDDGLVLQREVENAQRLYDSVTARFSQSTLEMQANQSYSSVLSMAQPPSEPAQPKVLLYSLAAIVAGMVISVSLTLLREVFDRRVRSADDLVMVLGVPVLESLPGNRRLKHYEDGSRLVTDHLLPGGGMSGQPLLRGGN